MEALESTESSIPPTRTHIHPPPPTPVVQSETNVGVVPTTTTTRVLPPPTTIPKKRGMVGLSKRTNSTLHQSTHAEASLVSVSTNTSHTQEPPSMIQTIPSLPQETTRIEESSAPKKRVRVGLSKSTTSSLHASARLESSAMQVDPVPLNVDDQSSSTAMIRSQG